MNALTARNQRPMLVWALYLLHGAFLLPLVAYELCAFGLLSLGPELDATYQAHAIRDHLIVAVYSVGCFYSVHSLFFRKPQAVLMYLISSLVYLLPNLARYASACISWAHCPNSDFLLNVALNFSLFLVGFCLVALASRLWPPLKAVTP
jgi:hypothetical protein